jgi:subtilisin family serine protease
MQRSFIRITSQTVRMLSAFAGLSVFIFLLIALLPPGSTATSQDAQSEVSQKRSRPEFVPGQVLVRYRSERAAARKGLQTLVSTEGRQLSIQLKRFEGSDLIPGLRLAQVGVDDTMAAIAALQAQDDVLYAEPNYRWYRTAAVPNDPCFPVNTLLDCHSTDLYGLNKIGAPQAWDVIKGSRDSAQAGFGTPRVVVGVIDEGIDTTHADLMENIWTNPSEVAGNGVDDDTNGFIDDVNGYDFFNNTGAISPANHATHVAGIIGARGNNNTGVVGVNWQVGLMSLKFLQSNLGSTSDAIRASAYAKQMRDRWVSSGGTQGANIRVLNNSWGPDRRIGNGLSVALRDTILSVAQSGILFVVTAGNDAIDNDVDPGYPGSFDLPNLISVAATDRLDALSISSNFGASAITMGAPGVGILSTTNGNTYSVMNGTSTAAPYVSGAAALLLAANPNLTIAQLKGMLIFNGDPLPSLAGKTLTGRRLNVAGSLQALAENDTTPPGTVTNFHLNSQNGRFLNVGWIASGDDGAAGTASLYKLTFTDTNTGEILFLKSVLPVASGASQSVDVKLPYRHVSGTLTLREFDNVGNEGTPATNSISVSLIEGDPYLTSQGSPVSLSVGGTALALNCDDCSKARALPFSFPFFGENFNSVTVSSNGALYFSPPLSNDSGGSLVLLPQFKMIAGLWDDLRTDRAGGDVYVVTPDATRIIFRWQAVTFGNETPETEFPVNFEIELRSNGTILTRYGAGNTHLTPVVGISAGEPEAYVILSHTSERVFKDLTNAPEVTFLPRSIGITSNVEFSASQFTVNEDAGAVTITVTRAGDTSTQASVDYLTVDGSATQKGDYMVANGTLRFAAGETSKTFSVLIVNDAYQEAAESFSISLTNPVGTALGTKNISAITINANDSPPPTVNPLDNPDALFFVRQHYMDFLNREPDIDGLNFWAGGITACGANQACIVNSKINVSAAFFLSIEFQETGYLTYRTYKAAYGDAVGSALINGVATPISVPMVRFGEFLTDTAQIAVGVQVGIGDWKQQLENNKQAYMLAFVQRSRFTTAYPTSLTPSDFVNQLFLRAGVTPSAQERQDAVGEFGTEINTTDVAARARVLRRVAENNSLKTNENNRAFVLMQYFGYLRRNPDDLPDSDHTGWKFWLTKLEEHHGNFVEAEMVWAFLSSFEYRNRFGL